MHPARRQLLGGSLLALSGLLSSRRVNAASELEKPSISISVGGQAFLQYAPLTLAQRLGYFFAEGLQVNIIDLRGGAQALQSVVAGSTDFVAGSFDHLIQMQAKHQPILGVVLFSRLPGIAVGLQPGRGGSYNGPQDLKGLKIGVTAPGSQTSFVVNYMLVRAGLSPADVSFVAVGSGASAVAAMQRRLIDGMSNADPAITELQARQGIDIVADTRTLAGSNQVFGTAYPSGTIYSRTDFILKNPRTTQAVVNAIVKTLSWLRAASPDLVQRTLPPEWSAADPTINLQAIQNSREIFSLDGRFTNEAGEIAKTVLSDFDPSVRGTTIDLSACYSNRFLDAMKLTDVR